MSECALGLEGRVEGGRGIDASTKCVVPENVHTHLIRVNCNSQVVGVPKANIFKGKYEGILKFPGGGGGGGEQRFKAKKENLSVEGYQYLIHQ